MYKSNESGGFWVGRGFRGRGGIEGGGGFYKWNIFNIVYIKGKFKPDVYFEFTFLFFHKDCHGINGYSLYISHHKRQPNDTF